MIKLCGVYTGQVAAEEFIFTSEFHGLGGDRGGFPERPVRDEVVRPAARAPVNIRRPHSRHIPLRWTFVFISAVLGWIRNSRSRTLNRELRYLPTCTLAWNVERWISNTRCCRAKRLMFICSEHFEHTLVNKLRLPATTAVNLREAIKVLRTRDPADFPRNFARAIHPYYIP